MRTTTTENRMRVLMIFSRLWYGFLSSSFSVGSSVASASAPKESMIILTHSNCIAVSVECDDESNADEMNVLKTVTRLTDSWNCKNLRTPSKIFLPHITAFTILVKLSSRMTMSHAS